MATKTIGLTGRNYATMAAYASYANALALTAPEVFEVYNDGGAVADTTAIVINGYTGSSSTNTITGRPATGQGFRDNANVLTNALRYNAANGAALSNSVGSTTPYTFGPNFILDGLQVINNATSNNVSISLGAGSTIRNSIIDGSCNGGYVINATAANITVENSVVVCRGTAGGIDCQFAAVPSLTVTDCLLISPVGGGSRGIRKLYDTAPNPLVTNSAFYGFSNDFQYNGNTSSANNATSLAASTGATSWGTTQTSITAAEWVSLTSGSEDFRVVSSSTKLKGNGATVGPALGIRGNTRTAPYTIGPDQYPNAAPNPAATISYTEANDTSAITANVAVTGVSGTVSYTEANDTSAITGSVTATTATITTGAFKNNTGSVLASLTALTVTVLNASTLAFVKTFTAKTTDASGIMTLNDALLVSGTQYAVVTTNASGTLGVEKYTAA